MPILCILVYETDGDIVHDVLDSVTDVWQLPPSTFFVPAINRRQSARNSTTTQSPAKVTLTLKKRKGTPYYPPTAVKIKEEDTNSVDSDVDDAREAINLAEKAFRIQTDAVSSSCWDTDLSTSATAKEAKETDKGKSPSALLSKKKKN